MLLPAISLAQNNFKPGFVVTLKGDTVHGQVSYKEWFKNPQDVQFKNNSGQVSTYTTVNTAAFGVDGFEHYRRFIMPISMDQTEFARLHIDIDSTKKIDTVFLHVITKGKNLTLYDYNDEIKRRYIIEDNHYGQTRELTYHKYIDIENSSRVVTNDNYKNELIVYAMQYGKNNPDFISRIRQTAYNLDIAKIVNDINGQDENMLATKSKLGTRFYIGAAVSAGTLRYIGNFILAQNPQYNPILFPQLTLGFDFLGNRNTGRLIFRCEAGTYVTSLKAYSSYNSQTAMGTIVSEQDITFANFYFAPQLIYNFYNTQALKIFGGAGIQLNVAAYSKNNYAAHDDNGPRNLGFDKIEMQNIWLQFPIKAGVTLKNKWEIYTYYYKPTSLTSNYVNFQGRITVISIGFNYLFGIK